MELGRGCQLIEEMENGDFRIQEVDPPDSRDPKPEVVLITAANVDAIIPCDIWYVLQTRRHVQLPGACECGTCSGGLRFFANREDCKIRRLP